MKVLIAGEGKTEIGFWTLPTEHHTEEKKRDERGLIEAFLSRCQPDGWNIVEGVDWRRIVKYKARRGDAAQMREFGPEGKTVLGLALRAEELDCQAVIFVRDRDDDAEREKEIENAIHISRDKFTPRIAGGVAAQAIESWLLSLKGERNAERYGCPKDTLREKYGIESLADRVAVVEEAKLDDIRRDAQSLRSWLEQVRAILEESKTLE